MWDITLKVQYYTQPKLHELMSFLLMHIYVHWHMCVVS